MVQLVLQQEQLQQQVRLQQEQLQQQVRLQQEIGRAHV